MAESSIGGPGRRPFEKTSLFGLVSFRPRVAVVLAFLTVTVAVVAFRITRDSGLGRVDLLAREAVRIFTAAEPGGLGGSPQDPESVEARIRDLTGAAVAFPRDVPPFAFGRVTREKLGRKAAAAVRLLFEEDLFVLLVVRSETLGRRSSETSLFGGEGFISGEIDGHSFVFWEKGGTSFFLVSHADLTRTFDLVRRHFT